MIFGIVIPVLNGEKYIGRCIDSINDLESGNYQIKVIVIDNGSVDTTPIILADKGIEFLVCKNVNVSQLRNIGANLLDCTYIGFVDSDCLVSSKWMVEAINILESDNSIGMVGRFYDVGDSPTWVEKAWCARRQNVEGPVAFLPAGNMVMKKDLFLKVGGFSNKVTTGEDYELCQRIRESGYLVINSQRVNVKHLGNSKKLTDIIRKERWYGLGMFSTLKRDIVSKPLLMTLVFITMCAALFLSFFLNRNYVVPLLICFVLFIFIISCFFTKNVLENRITTALKFMPISLCYLLGRSMSIYDVLIKKR